MTLSFPIHLFTQSEILVRRHPSRGHYTFDIASLARPNRADWHTDPSASIHLQEIDGRAGPGLRIYVTSSEDQISPNEVMAQEPDVDMSLAAGQSTAPSQPHSHSTAALNQFPNDTEEPAFDFNAYVRPDVAGVDLNILDASNTDAQMDFGFTFELINGSISNTNAITHSQTATSSPSEYIMGDDSVFGVSSPDTLADQSPCSPSSGSESESSKRPGSDNPPLQVVADDSPCQGPDSASDALGKPSSGFKRVRRFVCLEKTCTRMFTSEYTRKTHMQTHKPREPKTLHCETCDEVFSRKHDLLRHEVAQHGKECEFICEREDVASASLSARSDPNAVANAGYVPSEAQAHHMYSRR
ncbi:hypothetical protein PUNSTDRAFT_125911 [Punctularia strigosozonata HHB-11173 SS5]|uniref:uncharacterized protein n=1 Tax=Punctularia strigosozonata (strain HHB-11173) TaxID=741275 RepID=UPI00044162A4|nr:uncharacterized protein PUNSTDRAFT_125911 [Punctularia strigosozonata HHB-11173 SS5]EIN09918.1 hypothetical protein PUNSTDRAFT_125911 [Punctularia strigosozonata HHB-11173 SS5]